MFLPICLILHRLRKRNIKSNKNKSIREYLILKMILKMKNLKIVEIDERQKMREDENISVLMKTCVLLNAVIFLIVLSSNHQMSYVKIILKLSINK